MAVQKSKKSRSKKRLKRSNKKNIVSVFYFNKKNKEYQLYHHVSKSYYKNKNLK